MVMRHCQRFNFRSNTHLVCNEIYRNQIPFKYQRMPLDVLEQQLNGGAVCHVEFVEP